MKRQIKQMQLLCEASPGPAAQPMSPVLDVSFPAAKARRVDGERDGLEPSSFSSPHQLLHHLPVLVDLYTKTFMATTCVHACTAIDKLANKLVKEELARYTTHAVAAGVVW